MAVSVLGNGMLEMTAVNDEWTDKIKLCGGIFCYTAAASGTFTVQNSNGDVVYTSGAMNANEVKSEDLIGWVDGIKVTSIPTGGKILFQHK